MTVTELDKVVLTRDVPLAGLSAGDVGVVVLANPAKDRVELEVFSLTGDTIAVATVPMSAVRKISDRDIATVRPGKPNFVSWSSTWSTGDGWTIAMVGRTTNTKNGDVRVRGNSAGRWSITNDASGSGNTGPERVPIISVRRIGVGANTPEPKAVPAE